MHFLTCSTFADLFTELDSAFSKLFTKSDDNTYLSEQVSESGELRIDDICKVLTLPHRTALTLRSLTLPFGAAGPLHPRDYYRY